MANQYNPNDPYRTGQSDDEYYRSRLEREAQIDPELAEGPARPVGLRCLQSASPWFWAWCSTG